MPLWEITEELLYVDTKQYVMEATDIFDSMLDDITTPSLYHQLTDDVTRQQTERLCLVFNTDTYYYTLSLCTALYIVPKM